MDVSSMKGDFCGIKDFTPSSETSGYIKKINHIADLSGMLAGAMSAAPLYQIFAGRKSYPGVSTAGAGYNILSHEWEVFASSVKSIGLIKRRMILTIATEAALYSSGDDGKFWRCVVNAL